MRPHTSRMGSLLLFACVLAAATATARTLVVDQRNAKANDRNPGTPAEPLATINRAAQLAQPGDTVLVHAGVYRERVAPARGGVPDRPITYAAAPGEVVSIRGSEVFKAQWQPVADAAGLYTASLRFATMRQYNPFAIPLLPERPEFGSLGQVFVNGCPLEETTKLAEVRSAEGRWMVWEGALLVHFPRVLNPETSLVEISVRRRVFAPFRRGLGYIVVRGFVIEHCANPYPLQFWESESPQQGAIGTRAGHHWTIEDNVIRYTKSIGLDVGSEGEQDSDRLQQDMPERVGFHLIRHNVVSDNGLCGIAGWKHRETKVLGNIAERNGTLHTNAYEEAGIKMHELRDGLVEGNLVRDNETHGIWMDNRNLGSRVTRNVVYGNRSEGIFVELESGPVLVDHNVVCCSRESVDAGGKADGYYMHDASGVLIENNLIFDNPGFGVRIGVMTHRPMDMPSGLAEASDNRIRGNVIAENLTGALSIPDSGLRVRDNSSDANVFDPSALFARPAAPAGTGAPPMSITRWRIRTSFDEFSRMEDVRVRLLRDPATVEMDVPGGSPIGAGPFPSLGPGRADVRVWPVEGIGGPAQTNAARTSCAVASK